MNSGTISDMLSSLTHSKCFIFLDKVAPHKQLTGGVRFVNSIPKSPAGKLLRKELKNFLLAELEQRY